MSYFQKADGSGASKGKIGIFGDTGSGKTFTAALIAIGIHKYIKSKKPVVMIDTETGSDYLRPMFKKAGVPLEVMKSRSFPDLLGASREAEKIGSVQITDSITHIWDDFKRAYLKKTGQKFIEIWDWAPLKLQWQEWTDLFVNSDIHQIMCGRAAAVYEMTEEIRDGKTKKVANKVGAKMRTESEGGYEPSLLLQMEKVFEGDDANGVYQRVCHVVKDRFDVIDSKDFKNPTFECFLPHFQLLNLEGTHMGIDTSRNSLETFDDFGDTTRSKRVKRRAILAEEIAGSLNRFFPGMGAKEKLAKQEVVFNLLKTRSWKAVEEDWSAVPLERMEEIKADPGEGVPSLLEQECIKMCEQQGLPLPGDRKTVEAK